MSFQELNELPNLQFIPINEKKIPIVKGWQTSRNKHDLTKCYGVGLVCGKSSEFEGAMMEVIDIDLKYDISGTLFTRFKNLIHEMDSELLKKIVVQKTRSGGYHFIYRCNKIEGNLKLANRPTTEQERQETYKETYEKESLAGKTDEDAKKVAEKSSANDKVRVLLETRGLGGYIAIAPTQGYEFVYGDIYSITTITESDRDTLITIARQFNQVLEETNYVPQNRDFKKEYGLSPFDDYNKRGDVVGLLQRYGWTIVGNKAQKTIFKRPGQTSALSSGNFDHQRNWFSVFTTSTEFQPNKAYLPCYVYAKLVCNDDYVAAAKKLAEEGYGERIEKKSTEKKEYQSTRKIQSRINEDEDDLSFLASPDDYKDYLQQVMDGTLPMGLTTGSPALDEHFMFKLYSFVNINGIDNVGKSVFFWWLLMIAAMYHGWCGIIFSSENTVGNFMRKMIQFYWGKPLTGRFKMSDSEFQIAKTFVEEHFIIIKAQEDLYNYKDIINMVKKARKKYPKINYGLIDPYNSLKIDLSGFSKLSTHEYHYEALSELKAYGQQSKFGWFINHHAITGAARTKDAEKKYVIAPEKQDTEGGGKVSNKSDDFLTIHRVTNHPTDWMVTEVHVRKIKDTETGGKVTYRDSPVKFEMYNGGCGFIERLETGGIPQDPIHNWHQMTKSIQSELKLDIQKPNESFNDSGHGLSEEQKSTFD